MALWTLYFIVFVDFFQLSFIWPLLPKVVEVFGKGATEIGILGSVSAAAEGLAAPLLGSLADRVGRRPVFIIAMIGCSIATTLIGLAPNYYFLLAAQLMSGACGGTASVAAAYIADVTAPEERASYMTYFQAAIFLGLSAGPSVGGLMNTIAGYKGVCFMASGICAANLLCLIAFLPDSRDYREDTATLAASEASGPAVEADDARVQECAAGDAEQAAAPTSLPRCAYVIGAASFLNGIGFTAFEALCVLYLQLEFFNGDPDPATLFCSHVISGVGVVGLIVNLFLYTPIERRTGLRGSIVLGGLCATLGFVGIGTPISTTWFFVACQVFVFGDNIMSTSIQTMITLVVHPTQFGKAMGMMTLFQNIARAFGPFAFAPMFEHVSKTLPWYINAGCKLVAVCLCMLVPLAVAATTTEPSDGEARRIGDNVVLTRCLSGQTLRAFRMPGGLAEAMIHQLCDEEAAPGLPARSVSWTHSSRHIAALRNGARDLRRVVSS